MTYLKYGGMVGWWWISTRGCARSLSGRCSELGGGEDCEAFVSMMEWSTKLGVVKLFTEAAIVINLPGIIE